MSNFRLIEIVSDSGEGFAFGPPEMEQAGEPVVKPTIEAWSAWLQDSFKLKFAEQAGHWEAVLAQAGPWQPAQAPRMTFMRVARQIDVGKLRAWRLTVPEPAKQADAGVSDNAETGRSQVPAGGNARPTASIAPEPKGATADHIGPGLAQMQTQGDPVAPVTGEEILTLDDFSVSAPMPMQWRRWYRSRHIERDLGLGAGWFAECLRRVWQDDEATWLLDQEARPVRLPLLGPGEIAWQAVGGQRLERKQDGRMVLTERDGRVWILAPDNQGHWRPISVQNALGHQWLFFYDAEQRLSRLDLSPRKYLEFAYGKGPQLRQINLRQDDQVQKLAAYEYDHQANLISASTTAGTERYAYQGNLLAERQLATGYHFTFEWDGLGARARCLRSFGEDGSFDFRFNYQPEKFQTLVTDAFGNVQVFHYDNLGRITARQDPDGGTHQWRYNARGQLAAYRLPDGRTTEYGFDPQGRPVLERLPDERVHRRTFSPLGLCTGETLPDGTTLTRRFDLLGRLLEEQRADGSHWHYLYDREGWLSEVCSDGGEVRRMGFDSEGQLLAEEDRGALNRFVFDAQGRVKGYLNQDLVTEYEYQGEQVSAVHQYPEQAPKLRRSRFYEYDGAARLTGFITATGASHRYEYDGLARPVRYERPDGQSVLYRYDKAQRLTDVIRPDGARWQLSYNSKGQVSACKAPDGRHIRFGYDAAGDTVYREQEGDWVQQLKRDAGGRILRQSSQGRDRAAVTRHFQYDAYGRRIGASCADRRLQWSHDAWGRVTGHHQEEHEVRYGYGPGGRLETIHLPDGTEIRYSYDRFGRWTTLAVGGEVHLQREFDEQGREQVRQAGMSRQTQVWDRHNRLVNRRWQGEEACVRRYSWDAESRLEQYSDTQEGTRQFQRDPQGQLVADGQQRYQYDSGGNRSSDETAIQQDRLLQVAGQKRRYDALGAETEIRGSSVQRRDFDAESQLIQLSGEGVHVQYGYDPLGRRAWRKSAEGKVSYLWHNEVLLGEQRCGLWQWYIRDPETDAPLLTLIQGRSYFYELDWRQAPIRLWDSHGEVVWQGRADAWGRYQTEGNIHQPLRLPGQFEDELTGLHFNRFRDYDPRTGRYLTPDPIGLRGGLNSYRYTPNPVDYIDPLGLDYRPPVTAPTAETGEMAPVPDDLPDLQEVSTLARVESAVVSAVSTTYKAVEGGVGWALGIPGGILGAAFGAAYIFQPSMPPEAIPDSVKDAAQASDLAYIDSRDTRFGDWEEVGFDEDGLDNEGLGLSQELFENSDESYHAKLYKNAETNDYMIAFRGTDEGADWTHNFAQAAGLESGQYKAAMNLAKQASDLMPSGSKLTFVGHSLGGGLASAASTVTGLPATTFNAAGLSQRTVKRFLKTDIVSDSRDIDAFYVKGDVLSAIQDPFQNVVIKGAAGDRIPLDNVGFNSPMARHGMANVGRAMGIILNRGGPGMGTTIRPGA